MTAMLIYLKILFYLKKNSSSLEMLNEYYIFQNLYIFIITK